jgi:hypothetical protein
VLKKNVVTKNVTRKIYRVYWINNMYCGHIIRRDLFCGTVVFGTKEKRKIVKDLRKKHNAFWPI